MRPVSLIDYHYLSWKYYIYIYKNKNVIEEKRQYTRYNDGNKRAQHICDNWNDCLVVMDKSCNACDNDDTVDIENRVGTDYKLLQ